MRNRRSLAPSCTNKSRSRNSPDVAANTCAMISPLHKAQTPSTQGASRQKLHPSQGSPAPTTKLAGCPPACWLGHTASGWLTNSTSTHPLRDERRAGCGEPMYSAATQPEPSKIKLLCSAALSPARIFHASLSRGRLPSGRQALEPAAGHAVPTRRVLSARRVELTDTAEAGATLRVSKPATKPQRPYFSSGPCAKPPGWSPQALDTSALGRSHRGAIGKAKLAEAIERTRALLQLPPD